VNVKSALLSLLMAAVFFCVGFGGGARAEEAWLHELKTLPVQDAGRVKPFDTFAREALQLVYGKRTYKKSSAVEVVFTWILVGDHWGDIPFVEVRHAGLKEALSLEKEKKLFTPTELMNNPKLPVVFSELQTKRERQEKLNPYFQAVQRLESQLGTLQILSRGQIPGMQPEAESDKWLAPSDLKSPAKEKFVALVQSFSAYISDKNSETEKDLAQKVTDFKASTMTLAPEKAPSIGKIKLEVTYNDVHPFMWAWIAYLLSAIFFISYAVRKHPWQNSLGWVFLAVGFLLHTAGMATRVYLAGRPPVSNMYETVVWVPWGALVFGFILERVQKSKLVLISSTCIAILCLILTDLAPAVLDPSLQPLEPVLRSTFWLSTHVLVISVSYAAFFLAFALGDLILYYYLRGEEKYRPQIQAGVMSIYRAIQIGVVLLALGIILGGIWADYSWGRFWGWDPKETWALIALLGYLAILHGRLSGWIRQFGLAVCSVLSFSLVIMAWYGVNFVLGAGLHSYGFGAGGVEYVTAFVVLHILYVTYVTTVRYSRMKIKS
jgi:ABC-type transport system involved in cytochrome c biogenesis permease subunit